MGILTYRIYFIRGLFSIYELIIISLIFCAYIIVQFCMVVVLFDQSLWDSELCNGGRVGRAFLCTSVLQQRFGNGRKKTLFPSKWSLYPNAFSELNKLIQVVKWHRACVWSWQCEVLTTASIFITCIYQCICIKCMYIQPFQTPVALAVIVTFSSSYHMLKIYYLKGNVLVIKVNSWRTYCFVCCMCVSLCMYPCICEYVVHLICD